MTETHATTAQPAVVFPPGRYGRRREPRRTPRWLTAVLVALVLIAGLAMAFRLYQQYGDRTYRPDGSRVTDIRDGEATIEFAVTLPAGGSAVCTVRALADSGEEVGRERVEVRAEPGQTRVEVVHRLATSARPRVVEVPGCGPAPQG